MPITFDNGHPWLSAYVENTAAVNNIGWYIDGTAFPVSIVGATTFLTRGKIYAVGGRILSGSYTVTGVSRYISLDSSGLLTGSWTTGTSLPDSEGIANACAILTKNRVYLVGGANGYGYTATNKTYTAPIDEYGVVGTWAAGPNLPTSLREASAAVLNGRLYVFGGTTTGSDYLTSIYYAEIDDDGVISSWSTAETGLNYGVYGASICTIDNKVQLVQGCVSGGYTNNIQYASYDSDGVLGSWTTASSGSPGAKAGGALVVKKDMAYLFGGYNSGGSTLSVYYQALATTKTLTGLGNYGYSLYEGARDIRNSTVATLGRIYIFGQGMYGSISTSIFRATYNGYTNDAQSYSYEESGVSGNFVQPLAVFSGTATTPIACFGNAVAPVAVVFGEGETDNTCYGSFVQPLASISGYCFNDYPAIECSGAFSQSVPIAKGFAEHSVSFGRFVSPLATLSGSATTPIIANVRHRSPCSVVSGQADAGIISDGSFDSPQPILSGYSSAPIVSWGRVTQQRAKANGLGTSFIACSGEFRVPRPVCNGGATQSILHLSATGVFSQPLARTGGTAYLIPVCNGTFVAPIASCKGKCRRGDGDALVLQFSRDVVVASSSNPSAVSPLHFGREAAIPGTTNPSTITPLEFSR